MIGDYRTKATLVDNKCSYFKRKLLFRTQDSDLVREVDHYQYTDLPDKGMPDEEETVMSLIERVNHEHSEVDWPILVFCKFVFNFIPQLHMSLLAIYVF